MLYEFDESAKLPDGDAFAAYWCLFSLFLSLIVMPIFFFKTFRMLDFDDKTSKKYGKLYSSLRT